MPITIYEKDIEYLSYYGNFYFKEKPEENTTELCPAKEEALSEFLTIIDTRNTEEFEAYHIRGSINIPKTELLDNPETAIAKAKNNTIIIRHPNLYKREKDAITQILKKHNPNITIAFLSQEAAKDTKLPFACKNENHSTVSTDITQNFINIDKIAELIVKEKIALTEENQKYAMQALQTLLQEKTKTQPTLMQRSAVTFNATEIINLVYFANFDLSKAKENMTIEQLKQIMLPKKELSKHLIIIDARGGGTFNIKYIRGSINIPKADLETAKEEIIRAAGDNIILICLTNPTHKDYEEIQKIFDTEDSEAKIAFLSKSSLRNDTLFFTSTTDTITPKKHGKILKKLTQTKKEQANKNIADIKKELHQKFTQRKKILAPRVELTNTKACLIDEETIIKLHYYENIRLEKIDQKISPAISDEILKPEDTSEFLTIIDLREADDFKTVHIRGSINVPQKHLEMKVCKIANDLKDKIIVIYGPKLTTKGINGIDKRFKAYDQNIKITFMKDIDPRTSQLIFVSSANHPQELIDQSKKIYENAITIKQSAFNAEQEYKTLSHNIKEAHQKKAPKRPNPEENPAENNPKKPRLDLSDATSEPIFNANTKNMSVI